MFTKGYKQTKEHKHRISLALRGKYCGKDSYHFGRLRSKETCKRISEALMGKHLSKETRKKIGLAHLGKPLTNEHRKKLSQAKKGFCDGKKNNMFGRYHSRTTRKKMRMTWGKDRSYRVRQCRQGLILKPNKPETILRNLLNKVLPNKYKYTGDDKVVIDGFNPDFMNCNGQKKIIELYGTYWHKTPKVIERDKRRKKSYKSLGYALLIIWEHELKNIERVTDRILKFNWQGDNNG